MTDFDFDEWRWSDMKQPEPPTLAETEKAILKVLSTSDVPLPEYDIVTKIIALLRPKEIWYQTIVDRLMEMVRNNRVAVTKVKNTDAEENGIWYDETRYMLKDPLDRLAGI